MYIRAVKIKIVLVCDCVIQTRKIFQTVGLSWQSQEETASRTQKQYSLFIAQFLNTAQYPDGDW